MDGWKVGDTVNLERCLVMNGRLDGHLVQGHVDTTAACTERTEFPGSWEYRFKFPASFAHLIIEKGSVSLNGISLTIFDITNDTFKVAIIPYTFTHTNMNSIMPGSTVNIEFDVIGKYVNRLKDTQTGVN
jgi:riboflavin synthase